jgi:uncharacterized YccA/Bax inhibitor family protein
MIGMWSTYSQQYLLAFVGVTTLVFALPIFIFPLVWARLLKWPLPDHTDLAVYFGRCLGALLIVVELFALRAALTGNGLVAAFELMTGTIVLMIVVHIYGAIKNIQPMTETFETGIWCGLLALSLSFFPLD